MRALRRWYVLWYWRRRFGKRVCRNCVHLGGVECCRRKERVYFPDVNSCGEIFTLYDAAKEKLHYDRYAK